MTAVHFESSSTLQHPHLARLAIARPIVSLDVETTSPNPADARIVELGIVRVEVGGAETAMRWRFNPGCPIPPEATAVHGITDADVAECRAFGGAAREVAAALFDADLVGYNLRDYDLPILRRAFEACGHPWPCEGAAIVDVFRIYRDRETRTLSDAVRCYLGREHAGAHGALQDARATLDVLRVQCIRYPDLSDSIATLDAASGGRTAAWVTACGRIQRGGGGGLVVAFGNHRGKALSAVDPGWLEWVLRKDFPTDVQDIIRAELERRTPPTPPAT